MSDISDGRCLPFIGAGFSLNAKLPAELKMPDWNGLANQLVEDAVRFFHGERYDLRAWVVMPNHVHALFKVDATPMAQILESWKKHSAQKANRLLKRRGEFWQADYWDTYMRDRGHERKTVRYIESNPAQAKLVLDPNEWLWSSARFRDEFSVLNLPS